MVGEFKHLQWGYGTMFLPDESNPSIGQEIRIQAWEETAELINSLPIGTWIKISSVFSPSMYRGKEQSNFVIGTISVLNNE